MNYLTPDEMAFFKAAYDAEAKAQANLEFVKGVLATKYNLQVGDQFTPEGQIVRLQELIREAGSSDDSASSSVQ